MASSPPPPSAFLYQQPHGYTPTYSVYSTDYPTAPSPTPPTHTSTATPSTHASTTYTPTTKPTPPLPPPIPLPRAAATTAASPPASPRPSLSLSVRSAASTSSLLQPPLARRPKPAKPKALLLESFPAPPTHIPPTPTPSGSGSGVNTPGTGPAGSFQQQQVSEYQQQQQRLSLGSATSSPRQRNLHLPLPLSAPSPSQAPSPSPASSGGATPYYTPAASPWAAHPRTPNHDQDRDEGGSGRRTSYGFEVEAVGGGRAAEGQRTRRDEAEAEAGGDGDAQTLTLPHIPHTKTTPPTPTAAAITAFASSSNTNEKTDLSSSGSSFVSARSALSSLNVNLRPRRSFDDAPSSPRPGASPGPGPTTSPGATGAPNQRNPPPTAPPRAPLPPVPGPSRISGAFAEQVLLGGRSSMLSAHSSLEGVRSSVHSGHSGYSGSSRSSRRRRRRRSRDEFGGEGREEGRESREGREEGREEGMERSSVYSTASGYSVASAYSAASGVSDDPFRNLGLGQAPAQLEKRPFSAALPSLHEQVYHPHPHSQSHPHPHQSSNQGSNQGSSPRSPPRSHSSRAGTPRSPTGTTPKSPRSPKSPTMPLSPLNPAVNLPLQQLVEDSGVDARADHDADLNLAPSLGRLRRLGASPLLHAAPLVGSEDTDQEGEGGRRRSDSDGWGAASMEGSALGLSTAGLDLERIGGVEGPRLVDVRMEDMGMSVELEAESVLGASAGMGVDRTPRKAGPARRGREYPTHAGHRANESIATVGPPDFSAYADVDSDVEGDVQQRGGGGDAWRYGETAYGGIVPEADDVLFSAASGSVVRDDGEQDRDDHADINYGATDSTVADGLSAPANLGLSEDSARRHHQQRDNAVDANQHQVPTHDHGTRASLGPAFDFPRSASSSSFAAATTGDDSASAPTTASHDQPSSSKSQDLDTAFRGFTFPATSASSLSTPVKQRDTTPPEPYRDEHPFQPPPPPRLITTAATPTPTRPAATAESSTHSTDETPTQARRTLNGKPKTHMRGGPANESGGSSSAGGKSSVGSVGSFSLPSRHPHSPLHALLPRVADEGALNANASASASASGGRRSGARDERRVDGVSSSSAKERGGVHSRLRSLSLSKSKEGAYAASAVFDATKPGMTATSPTSIGSGSSSRPPPPGHAYPTTPSKRLNLARDGSSNLVRPSFSTMTNLSAYTQHSGASEAEAESVAEVDASTSAMSATSASSSSRAASSSSTLHDTTEDDEDTYDDDEEYYGAHPGETSLLDIDMGEMDDVGMGMGIARAGQVKARRPGSAFGLGGVDEDEFGAFIDPSATSPAPTTPAMASAPGATRTLQGLKQTQSVKDLRLELRAERTRSPALRRVYSQRSAAGLAAAELLDDGADGVVVSVPAASGAGAGGEGEDGGEGDSPPATASSGGTDVGTDPHMHATASLSSRAGLGLGFPSSTSARRDSDMTMDEFGVTGRAVARISTSASSQATVSFDLDENDPRAPSPDIASILSASTGRRGASRSRRSSRSKSKSQRVVSDGAFVASPTSSSYVDPLRPRRQSEGVVRVAADGGRVRRRAATQDEGCDAYDARVGSDEEETLVGTALARAHHGEGEDAGGDSDSSLDLHTPLPNLMVRDGLLSPHSKLLPAASRATTPYAHGPDGRPGSTMSLVSSASHVTKSGVIKDERDTPMRRVRHRDGKLLAGGIGLTTGLGWSDSEDEDAPSPLTRRLSALNLSRRSSASSVLPSSSSAARNGKPHHPLARSYSSGALLESDRTHHRYHEFGALGEEDEEDDYGVVSKPSAVHVLGAITGSGKSKVAPVKAMAGAPPTAWQGRKSTSSSVGSRNSVATDDGGKTPPSSSSRMRLPSSGANSAASAAAAVASATSRLSSASSRSTPYSGAHITTPLRRPSADDQLHTPSSTASTLSLPMPTTPKDTDSSFAAPSPAGQKLVYNKNKSLPPLPAGGLKKTPSSVSAKSTGSARVVNTASTSTVTAAASGPASPKFAFPRARTFSATAAQSASAMPAGSASPAVRPLQLPRHAGARANGDRAAVPVPSIPSSSSSSQQQSSSRLGLRTPSLTSAQLSGIAPSLSPSSPPVSPMLSHAKPRTGTGMVYRSSSSFGAKMRTAPLALSSSVSTSVAQGVVGSSSSILPRAAGGSIGRAGGKAIPF